MLISEMIVELEELKTKHGDLSVYFNEKRNFGYSLIPITEVSYIAIPSFEKDDPLKIAHKVIALNTNDEAETA